MTTRHKIALFLIPVICVSLMPSVQAEVSDRYFEEYQDWAKKTIEMYVEYGNSLNRLIEKLTFENEELRKNNDYLQSQLDELKFELKNKDNKITQFKSDFSSLNHKLYDLERKVKDNILESKKPKTVIDKTMIYWTLFDSKGNQYDWKMPVSTYESNIQRDFPGRVYLYNDITNEEYLMYDFAEMVESNFIDVIDEVYYNSDDDNDFIYEIWYIVSQLTVYDEDIGEYPRYALETLTRGGGDCEDLSILIADMLKSSAHTKDWEIDLIYFDSDNPTKPLDVNHVIVYVNDGKYDHFIESTSSPAYDYYPEGIRGWAYSVLLT